MRFLSHPNDIRVEGKPLFLVYKQPNGVIPILQRFQVWAREAGFKGLYLVASQVKRRIVGPETKNVKHSLPDPIFDAVLVYSKSSDSILIPEQCERHHMEHYGSNLSIHPLVLPYFDNPPRREFKKAVILYPDGKKGLSFKEIATRFQKNLEAALTYQIECQERLERKDRFVVVSSWNEWAEGLVLE